MSIVEDGDKPRPRKKPGPVPKPRPPKKEVGRPTKYDPAMCAKLVAMGKLGMSKCEMAAEIDICVETFNQWEKQHKDFSEASKRAVQLSQAWWERKGRESTFSGGPLFNATSYIFQMKNRFREAWNDTKNVNQTNEDGPNRAKAAAEDRARSLELIKRLGLGDLASGTRDAAPGEGEGEFPILRDVHRRTGRTS